MSDDLRERIKRAYEAFKNLTPEDRARHVALQQLSFAYGNLACTTNHRPVRAVFMSLALAKGMSEAEFDAWAADKEWR